MDMLNLRGLIQYSIKNAYNSYNNKNPTTNLIFKRAKDLNRHFTKDMHGKNTQEKMLQIISHQINVNINQNYMSLPTH